MVQQALRGSKYRDRVEVSYLPAATREDLMQGAAPKVSEGPAAVLNATRASFG